MATASGGTAFPPWAASDFSCALNGTLALIVEPGEKATPANFNEVCVAAAEAEWNTITRLASKNWRLQMCCEAPKIMLFRIPNQKACGTEFSNLI